MNVSQMFRAVSEGRVVTAGGYAWSCPQCGAILGQSVCREARDRCALAHCLLHSAVAAPVPKATTSPYFHMAPHRRLRRVGRPWAPTETPGFVAGRTPNTSWGESRSQRVNA